MKAIRALIFALLRLYVAVERPFRAFRRWWKNEAPDIVIEPLSLPANVVPDVRGNETRLYADGLPISKATPDPKRKQSTPVFLDNSLGAAYGYDRNGRTLRRVAQDDEGTIVYLKKLPKKERRALKRAQRRHGTDTAETGA